MLDANTTHIALTLEGASVDLQALSFIGREALNQPFCTPLHASSEDRLTLVRKHLTRDDQDKEPLI